MTDQHRVLMETGATMWLVTGFDVGGNSGATIEAVFDNLADAHFWAEHSPDRKHNMTFWGNSTGTPFEVEEHEVVRLSPETSEG